VIFKIDAVAVAWHLRVVVFNDNAYLVITTKENQFK